MPAVLTIKYDIAGLTVEEAGRLEMEAAVQAERSDGGGDPDGGHPDVPVISSTIEAWCDSCGKEIEPHASGLCDSCETAKAYDAASRPSGPEALDRIRRGVFAALAAAAEEHDRDEDEIIAPAHVSSVTMAYGPGNVEVRTTDGDIFVVSVSMVPR